MQHATPAQATYSLDPLGQTSVHDQLQQGGPSAGHLQLTAASAEVFADPPAKATGAPGRDPNAALAGMLAAPGRRAGRC